MKSVREAFKQALRKFLWAAQNNDVNSIVPSLYIPYDYVMFCPTTFQIAR